MQFRTPAIVCAARHHGETGVVAQLLTARRGMIAGNVAGGRGRELRPVLIPGNLVDAELRSRSDSQMPSARIELVSSRGPWLTEPLPAAAIAWTTGLAAAALPERQPYPAIYDALYGLLDAVCVAPSARGWAVALMAYEVLVLRELGYGVPVPRPATGEWGKILQTFDLLGRHIARYPLADRRSDVMAARELLRERLARITGD